MAKLQLALDGDLAAALQVLEAAHRCIDIVEVGTPLVYHEGMHAVRRLRVDYAELPLVADLKIMDGGQLNAAIAFDAGADVVTVMAQADDTTVQGALDAAAAHRKRLMIDLMGVADPVARALELSRLGCDEFCLHTAHELRAARGAPHAHLARLREALPGADLAIAGGITLAALEEILPMQPQVVIIGSAITAAADPHRAAQQFQRRIRAHADA